MYRNRILDIQQDRNTNTKNVVSLATFLYLDEGSKGQAKKNETISAAFSCLEDEDEGGVKHEK